MTTKQEHDATVQDLEVQDRQDRQIDELLRRSLEPAPGAAERIARRALLPEPSAAEPGSSGRPRFLRPAVVAVGLLALVAGASLTIPLLVPRPTQNVAIHPGVDGTVPPTPKSPESSRLSISNAGGPVTVTTADGTRWIALPRDESVRNGG